MLHTLVLSLKINIIKGKFHQHILRFGLMLTSLKEFSKLINLIPKVNLELKIVEKNN